VRLLMLFLRSLLLAIRVNFSVVYANKFSLTFCNKPENNLAEAQDEKL